MRFWVSDTHIGHTNVIKYCSRPYSSVEEMNEMLVSNWNNVVKPDDEVYCLGDFSMSFTSVEAFSHRLMGKKYLVPGNHDFCHSYHKKSRNPENRQKWIQKYVDNGWTVLPEQTTMDLDGIGTVNMCHHPYSNDNSNEKDSYDDKYKKWRPVDDGKVLLCGHIHEKWLSKKTEKGSLMVNVGVDVFNYTPVSEDELVKLIKSLS